MNKERLLDWRESNVDQWAARAVSRHGNRIAIGPDYKCGIPA